MRTILNLYISVTHTSCSPWKMISREKVRLNHQIFLQVDQPSLTKIYECNCSIFVFHPITRGGGKLILFQLSIVFPQKKKKEISIKLSSAWIPRMRESRIVRSIQTFFEAENWALQRQSTSIFINLCLSVLLVLLFLSSILSPARFLSFFPPSLPPPSSFLQYTFLFLPFYPFLNLLSFFIHTFPFLFCCFLVSSFLLSFAICYPFLFIPFLSTLSPLFPQPSFPFLPSSLLTYPVFSIPFLSFPFPSISAPLLSFPFPSFPSFSFPFISFPFLSAPFLSLQFLYSLFLSSPLLSFAALSSPYLSFHSLPFVLSVKFF